MGKSTCSKTRLSKIQLDNSLKRLYKIKIREKRRSCDPGFGEISTQNIRFRPSTSMVVQKDENKQSNKVLNLSAKVSQAKSENLDANFNHI